MGCGASKEQNTGAMSVAGVERLNMRRSTLAGGEIDCLMELEVVGGEEVPDMDIGGGADPFVVVTFGRHVYRTTTCKRSKNPNWEQLVYFFVTDLEKGFKLFLELYDEDKASKNDHISSADISITTLISSGESPIVLQLKTPDGKDGGKLFLKAKAHRKEDIERLYWSYVFEMFDSNRDGTLDKDELAVVLKVVGSHAANHLDKFFSALDKDGNMKVDATEFCNFMSSEEHVSTLPADMRSSSVMRDIVEQIQLTCKASDRALPEDLLEAKDENTVWVVALFLFQSGVGVFGDKMSKNPVQKLILSESHSMTAHGAAGIADKKHTEDKEGRNSGTTIFYQDRRTGRMEKEAIPAYVKLGMSVMYGAKPELAAGMLKRFTKQQSAKYDSPSSTADIQGFIDFHNISTDECLLELNEYKTFNEFFYRKLRQDARPIASADEGSAGVVVCPADARTLVFNSFEEAQTLWVKGRAFTVGNLVKNSSVLESLGEKPHVCVSRLAPQDYHRFHAVCAGKIISMTPIEGEYYTVNPVAVRSSVDVFTENARVVVEVETPCIGTMVYVAVGATLVGSINFTVKEGDTVAAGQDFGYFAFGGSTVITLFKKDSLAFDRDLVNNTMKPTETLTRMGESLATVKQS
eukprot:TRINITY_DN1224_c0_g3_i1.p1 TRINITY_DN1224_c0_g3~~TRINITY_DN1224_c0_g3_i1.p1  ORF type:complete len:635 (+),score=181.32 TRINITY_DN1224_c0_g3_i1:33-1937(+)